MIRIRPEDFWPRYRDEVRRTGSLDALQHDTAWTCVAIEAAKTVCATSGLKTCHELHLDVMGYEQREAGVDFNWDLRVAFEHENTRNWHDELCKLCHVVADLRVLVGYFTMREHIEQVLQQRIDVMRERLTRVQNGEWLFIFGPNDSERNRVPWTAFTLNAQCRVVHLADAHPFNPYAEFSERAAKF